MRPVAMCQETISVLTIGDERMAYEVEQYLVGLPFIDDVDADFLDNKVRIVYDDNIPHDRILDELEHSGVEPKERVSGVMGNIKAKLVTTTEKLK